MKFEIWDTLTGAKVGKKTYSSRRAATIVAERMNQAYGSHRYAVDLI